MGDKLKQTVRLERGKKVGQDAKGNSVWVEPIETVELELMNTVMLKKILDSDNEEQKQHLKSLATERDGVLARDSTSKAFEIIKDNELEAALAEINQTPSFSASPDTVPESASPAGDDELSLVSTQMLRHLLSHDESPTETHEGKEGGYNPYDSG